MPQLQQDIANLAAELNSDSAMTDTIIAKMLLDECTLAAALRQLRVYNNATSINELCAALNLPAKETGKLLEVYASFSSRKYFDEEFEQALKQAQGENLSDEQLARKAVDILLAQAQQIYQQAKQITAQNRTDLFTLADQYHLGVTLTAQLELLYSQPASVWVRPEFEALLKDLKNYNPDERLCASLVARTLLFQITPKDARDIAITSRLLNNELLEEDLLIIACRYLKVKTPQDIAAAYDAVLKKLPYADNPEENLGLAVRVLLDGTPESFERATQNAALKRDTELLRRYLVKQPTYAGFEYDLAAKFGGKKSADQLEQETQQLLQNLPHCVTPQENKELACKVLLGIISEQEANQQATYMRDLKAVSLTKGLAPDVMKHYRGTKPAQEIIQFFNQTLANYTFWQADREKHIFALRSLVEELNGTYDHRITQFVLDNLQNGASVEMLDDMLHTIQQQKLTGEALDALLEKYRTAQASAKTV